MKKDFILKCEKCGKEYKNQIHFKRHMEKCKKESNLATKRYICKICGKEFSSSSAIGGHMTAAHSVKGVNKKKNFKCKICGEILFTNKGAFENHTKNHNDIFREKKSNAISKAKKEFYANEERSKDTRDYMSNFMKEKNPMFHKENIEKMVQSRKEYFEKMTDKEYSEMVQNFINAPKKGNAVSHSGKYTPTRIEQMIIDLNIPGLIYNGNKKGAKTIRFKNKNYKHSLTPDFIYKYDEKKVIETFGVYWHPKEDEDIYVKSCEENNYNILILWENEIYTNIYDVKEKILKFLKGDN